MKKLNCNICDACRSVLYSGDKIVELCPKCANVVWCVFDDSNLISIHRTEEQALNYSNRLEFKNIVNRLVIHKWDILNNE